MKLVQWLMPLSALFFWFSWVQADPTRTTDAAATQIQEHSTLDDIIERYHSGYYARSRMIAVYAQPAQTDQNLIQTLQSNHQSLTEIKQHTPLENTQTHHVIDQLLYSIEQSLEQLEVCDEKGDFEQQK